MYVCVYACVCAAAAAVRRRAPPASILGAPEGDPLLQSPGGPLLLHRASTREGQEALLRGLWPLLPSPNTQGGPTVGAPADKGGPPGAPFGAPGYSTLPGYPAVKLPGAPHRRLLRRLFCPPINNQQQLQQQQQQQQQRVQWLHRWQWADDLLLLRLKECLAARKQALKMQVRQTLNPKP